MGSNKKSFHNTRQHFSRQQAQGVVAVSGGTQLESGDLFPGWAPEVRLSGVGGKKVGVHAGVEKGGARGMTAEQSLLEQLAMQMGCMYLSDLRFLDDGQRQYLAHKLEQIDPREDVWAWNDALSYLTGAPPEQTAQAAKERLINLLMMCPIADKTKIEGE